MQTIKFVDLLEPVPRIASLQHVGILQNIQQAAA